MEWRRFERLRDGRWEYREIRRRGIRCHERWGEADRYGDASIVVLADEQRARWHHSRKVNRWLRGGFTEVDRAPEPAELDQHAPVLDVLRSHRPGAEFRPVAGFADAYRWDGPASREYLVLHDQGRRAVHFTVAGTVDAGGHDGAAVAAFLEFLCARRELAFDGGSHHKVALPVPVGRFSHALFCSPALGQACHGQPAIADRVASAFPVFECEIGDDDTEALVDARLRGRAALPRTDWGREPQPVVDLMFRIDLPRFRRRERTYRPLRAADLRELLDLLPGADYWSWLQIRSFRGEITCFRANAPVEAAFELLMESLI